MRRLPAVLAAAAFVFAAPAMAYQSGGESGGVSPLPHPYTINLCVQTQAQVDAKPWLAKDIAATAGTGIIPHLRAAKLGMFNLMWAEIAIAHQVNTQVRKAWGTPVVRFACKPRNTRVFLLAGPGPEVSGKHPLHKDVIGYHWSHYGRLYIVVFVSRDAPWTVVLSHEVIERVVDPFGGHPEVADPVEGHWYRVWGRRMDDFVLPSWFSTQGHTAADAKNSRTDYLGYTSHPGEISHGYYGSKKCPQSTCFVQP